MQSCCIKGCDSFKHKETTDFCYFSFPIHDKVLLEKWLHRLQLPKWKPAYQICSMHFAAEDIDRRPNTTRLFLKPTSIPTIFRVERAIPTKSHPTCCNSIFTKTMTELPIQATDDGGNENCNALVTQTQPISYVPAQERVQLSTRLPTHYLGQTNVENISQKCDSRAMRIDPFCGQPGFFDQRLSILQSKFRKILPKPESSKPVPKANIPVISTVNHTDDSNNTVTSPPSCYLGKKRVILRITIHKLYDGLPAASCLKHSGHSAAKCTSCINGKTNNISDNKKPPGKEITIENSSTNRTVTFRLDPSIGEIVLAPHDSDASLVNKQKCKRSTSINQKPPSSVVRKSTRILRKRRAREQRNKKKAEIIATVPPIKRRRRNSRFTRSCCKTR